MKLSRGEVYNVWSFTSILPMRLNGMVLTQRFRRLKCDWALCWKEWRAVVAKRVGFRYVLIFFIQVKSLTNDVKFGRNIEGSCLCKRITFFPLWRCGLT